MGALIATLGFAFFLLAALLLCLYFLPSIIAFGRHTRGRFAFVVILLLLDLFSAAPSQALADGGCQFVLGFAALASAVPQVGQCVDNQSFAASGDAVQHAAGGLLVWRKADNWTAFTDGYHTWVNGPNGIQQRLNNERFPWEHDRTQANSPSPVWCCVDASKVALTSADMSPQFDLYFDGPIGSFYQRDFVGAYGLVSVRIEPTVSPQAADGAFAVSAPSWTQVQPPIGERSAEISDSVAGTSVQFRKANYFMEVDSCPQCATPDQTIAWARLIEARLEPLIANGPTADTSGPSVLPPKAGPSNSWSGYLTGGGAFTSIQGTWRIPFFTGSPGSTDGTWVGIGGVLDHHFIQAGTANFAGASSQTSAWYELPPAPPVIIPLTIHTHDLISINISLQPDSSWKISIANKVTNQAYSTSVNMSFVNNSAEWIEEVPHGLMGDEFGEIQFSQCSVVRDGQTLNLAQSKPIYTNMTDAGGQSMAGPTSMTSDGAGFAILHG
ncbi:MAG: G1 family glutamic endopeptidase [Chloroflexota bacterium]